MTLGRTTSRSAQAVTRLSTRSFVCLKIIEESFLGRWPSAFTCNDESYVSSFLVVIHVFVIQSGEGPTWCTPIKIQAPQGQVTLCSENFPESSLLRLWPLPLGASFHDDLTSDEKDEEILSTATSRCLYRSRTYQSSRAVISGFELFGARWWLLQLHVRQDRHCYQQSGPIEWHRDCQWHHFRTRHPE